MLNRGDFGVRGGEVKGCDVMTMVNVPDEALERAMKAAHTDSPEDAVVRAIEEFSTQHSQAPLIKLLGTLDGFVTPDELRESREMD
jgi:hypothetical protein